MMMIVVVVVVVVVVVDVVDVLGAGFGPHFPSLSLSLSFFLSFFFSLLLFSVLSLSPKWPPGSIRSIRWPYR